MSTAGTKTRLTISLVAHTNVGKTTLARTLLRRDVGEVFDQAHVTEVSEAYPLIESQDAALFLWDTPGLGDTLRLVKRLRKEGSPIGWFLHQVWDRKRDRPLWCSQEALRNVREDADVVLYLVNAGESPEDAGYVPLELEILNWIGRPTVVVLNQTGGTPQAAQRLGEEWRAYLRNHHIVRDVLALDAFTRSWVQENQLLEQLVPHFEGHKRELMATLAQAWAARNRAVFERSMQRIADFLVAAAREEERLDPTAPKSASQLRAAAEALLARIEAREVALWDAVIEDHGLTGGLASDARGMLDEVAPGIESLGLVEQALQLFEENKNTVKGAAGGLVTIGLAADILSGGLTLGGGALVGALLGGAMGRAVDRLRGRAKGGERDGLWLSTNLLARLSVDCLRRYLLLAHFGRGRGRVQDPAEAERWHTAVEAALAPHADALVLLLERTRGEPQAATERELARVLASVTEEILRA